MKNYRLALFVLNILLVFTAHADPISREQALKLAEQYMKDKPGSNILSPITSSRRLARSKGAAQDNQTLYYVFDRGQNQGFVIVPGDDSYGEVIGYTEEGSFCYDSLPPHMQNWLDGQAEYINFLMENPTKSQQQKANRKRVEVHASIEPMVTTKWGQG